jgi:hypothetical protein
MKYNFLKFLGPAILTIWGIYSLSRGDIQSAKILILMALIGWSAAVFIHIRHKTSHPK